MEGGFFKFRFWLTEERDPPRVTAGIAAGVEPGIRLGLGNLTEIVWTGVADGRLSLLRSRARSRHDPSFGLANKFEKAPFGCRGKVLAATNCEAASASLQRFNRDDGALR